MIVYERRNDFVMFEQHRHGMLSGDLAQHCQDSFLGTARYIPELQTAISQHDLAWVGLDAIPLWNDAKYSPFSFIDLPSSLKIPHYEKGMDAVERQSKYACLLCSLHYASFFHGSNGEAERVYFQLERNRQRRLQDDLGVPAKDIAVQLQILKFFDSLSLYICLNEPGTPKESEFPWYREGFPNSEKLPLTQGHRIHAHWQNEAQIGLTFFPFMGKFEVSVPLKVVEKQSIREHGIAKAYEHTVWNHRTVELSPKTT